MDADAKALTAVQVLSGFCYCCAAAVEMVVSATETTVAATDVTASGSSCFFCAAVVETTAIMADASNLIRSNQTKKAGYPAFFVLLFIIQIFDSFLYLRVWYAAVRLF